MILVIREMITVILKRITVIFQLIILSLFTHCTIEGIGVPILVSPINESTIAQNPPTFIWQSVEGANEYWLQVSTDPSFTQTEIDVACFADTNYTPYNSLNTGTHYWRVCAREGG
jgi:hypothetical protein